MSGNSYIPDRKLLQFSLISKTLNIRTDKTINLPVVLYGFKQGLLLLLKNIHHKYLNQIA